MAVELAIERTRIFRTVSSLRMRLLMLLSEFLFIEVIIVDFRPNLNLNLSQQNITNSNS
jgi:hypothetical protein